MRTVIALFFIIGVCFNLFILVNNLQASEFLPTSVEVQVSCGDGYTESSSGEVCDPGYPPAISADVGTSTCLDFLDLFGNYFTDGNLGCNDDCSDFATSSCVNCGNDYKENSEECDGNDFGGTTCITWGFSGGTLACTADCRMSTADCDIKESEGGVVGSGRSGGGSGSSNLGFNPGAEIEQETKVVIRGKSYPHAEVHILIDGRVVGIADTDARADFYFESSEITSGVASFGFWSGPVS